METNLVLGVNLVGTALVQGDRESALAIRSSGSDHRRATTDTHFGALDDGSRWRIDRSRAVAGVDPR